MSSHELSSSVISCRGVSRRFMQGDQIIEVLKGVDLQVARGEAVAIIGASGAGKSTLLHLMGGLDRPSAGSIVVNGIRLATQTETQLARLRNQALGFVYQFHYLLPEFSALENVAMPLLIGGVKTESAANRAREILARVGLEHRLGHKPGELSGGERQRTAVARAMVHRPQCLLADEPTGNLDQTNSRQIYAMMRELNAEQKTSLVVVTHDRQLAQDMDRCFQMSDGHLRALA